MPAWVYNKHCTRSRALSLFFSPVRCRHSQSQLCVRCTPHAKPVVGRRSRAAMRFQTRYTHCRAYVLLVREEIFAFRVFFVQIEFFFFFIFSRAQVSIRIRVVRVGPAGLQLVCVVCKTSATTVYKTCKVRDGKRVEFLSVRLFFFTPWCLYGAHNIMRTIYFFQNFCKTRRNKKLRSFAHGVYIATLWNFVNVSCYDRRKPSLSVLRNCIILQKKKT